MTQQPLISHRAVLRTWPGRSSAVGEGLTRLVEATRPLRGCLAIAASREPSDPRVWHLSMCWADEQAMAHWLASPVAELFARLVNQHLVMHIDIQPGAAIGLETDLRRAG